MEPHPPFHTGSKPVSRPMAAAALAVLLGLGAPGLARAAAAVGPPATAPATRPADGLPPRAVDTSRAYLLHVPGIAGETQIDRAFVAGVRDGGFRGTAEIYDWTGDQAGLTALVNRQRNDAEAQKVADRIADLRRREPGGQIILSAHSGGSGIIAFALEKLPPAVRVDGVLMLSPALSPDYDLSAALAHVNGKLYCFSSTLDVFVLGFGTKMFGTIDRKKADSAGRVGFVRPPDAADPAQYDKLVHCPYDRAWVRFGNVGDHITVMSHAFAAHVLSPLVLSHLPGGGGPLTRPVFPVNPFGPATRPDTTK